MSDARSDDPRAVTIGPGLAMPLIGFGTWDISAELAYDAVRLALDAGYRHIDTAYGYANEAPIGRALADSGVAREDVFITTKIPSRRIGHEDETVAASLRGLRTDYVDLWLIHDPPAGAASLRLWEYFIGLQARAAALSIGVSNYSTAQIDALVEATGVAPSVNQIRWTPALYDPVRVAELEARRIQLEGFSAIRRTNLDHPTLVAIAARHGVTTAQVVLRWHVEHRFVTLPRSTDPGRIRENIDVWDLALSPAEVTAIDGLGPDAERAPG